MQAHKDRGVAAVEAAMILPFLILFVFGVIDFSRAFFDAAKVQEAAQEGAIYASLNPTDPIGAIARAEETIQSPDFTGNITVTCPAADQVSVNVHYTFTLLAPLISNIFGPAINLDHSETGQVLSTSDSCTPSP